MKRYCSLFFFVGCASMITFHAFGGSEQIIKQRAKDIRDQNNAQQGVAPPARTPAPPRASSPPTQAAPAQTLTPQQQAMSRLQTSLAAIRPGTQVTPELKSQLTRNLIGASQATPKPSSQAATRLSEDLATALSQKLLNNPTRNRLVQNLAAILNPASMQASQIADIVTDIQAILESSGIPVGDAKKAASAAQSLAAELRKTTAK